MVLPFTPLAPANDSNRCSGIELYQAQRPPRSDAYRDVNLAFYGLTVVVSLISAVWMWRWRNLPRFHKIRPYPFTLLLLAGFIVYHTASNLAMAVPTPCLVLVMCYSFALAWFASLVCLRALIITVETQYAKLAMKESHVVVLDDASTVTSQSSKAASTVLSGGGSFASTIWLLLRVSVGATKVTRLSFSELVVTKNSFLVVLLLFQLPAIICCILLVALVEPLGKCVDCDVSIEIAIGVLTSIIGYVLFATRAAIVAFRTAGWDSKGVIVELFTIPLLVGNIANVTWVLVIVDPGNVGYAREFNWAMGFNVSSCCYWITCIGYQLYRQYCDLRTATVHIMDMQVVTDADAEIRSEFTQFAAQQYVTESIRFLEDTASFKRYFYEKGDSWRVSKFKSLVDTYILAGSNMEVNISYAMKESIRHLYANDTAQNNTKVLFDAFDEACVEVRQMLQNGAWREFVELKAKEGSKLSKRLVMTNTTLSAVANDPRRVQYSDA